jgi:hypothetical protein
MRILIIEDEQKTAAYLRKGLTENGYVVDVAEHGRVGEHLAQEPIRSGEEGEFQAGVAVRRMLYEIIKGGRVKAPKELGFVFEPGGRECTLEIHTRFKYLLEFQSPSFLVGRSPRHRQQEMRKEDGAVATILNYCGMEGIA